jgi:uncharacterized phage protein (TIGR01671 family)
LVAAGKHQLKRITNNDMKRSIKFRGLDYKNNWMFGTYYFGVMYPTSFEGHYINDTMINPETIGQFTGLKDRNGTEIYEGDVVKVDSWSCYFKIVWDEYYAHFKPEKMGTDQGRRMDHIPECEVIGNIHENPELLK